jgi:hypothetical protein
MALKLATYTSTSRLGLPTALPLRVRPVAFTQARPARTRSRGKAGR